jgi:hypothetical protein
LVVELIGVGQWKKELVARKRLEQDGNSTSRSALKERRKKRQGVLAKSLKATGKAYMESSERSRLYANFLAELSNASSVPLVLTQRLGSTLLKTGATVSDMGLVTAQAWGLTIMLGLLAVLLAIDKGCRCCGASCSDEESVVPDYEGGLFSKHSPLAQHITSGHLTTWEAIPGVELLEPPSDYHLG